MDTRSASSLLQRVFLHSSHYAFYVCQPVTLLPFFVSDNLGDVKTVRTSASSLDDGAAPRRFCGRLRCRRAVEVRSGVCVSGSLDVDEEVVPTEVSEGDGLGKRWIV